MEVVDRAVAAAETRGGADGFVQIGFGTCRKIRQGDSGARECTGHADPGAVRGARRDIIDPHSVDGGREGQVGKYQGIAGAIPVAPL